MREIDFLPAWYPRLRRRKRLVALHGWLTVVACTGLCLWIVMAQRNVRRAQASLVTLSSEMEQTQAEQRQLDEQFRMRNELRVKDQIVAQLGFPVEMSRLLRTLDEVMPKEMSLLEANVETEERIVHASSASALRATPDRERSIDRRLKIRLVGVAPTDVDLANFLAGLTQYSFLQQVALVKASDKLDNGHLMREFEVTFSMNLNQPLGR